MQKQQERHDGDTSNQSASSYQRYLHEPQEVWRIGRADTTSSSTADLPGVQRLEGGDNESYFGRIDERKNTQVWIG